MKPSSQGCVSSAAAMGPRAKAGPDCYKPTGGPVAAASLAPDAELARRQGDWAWCWSTACQASLGGSNRRAGVGITTESLARDGRGAALRDRSAILQPKVRAQAAPRPPKPTSRRGGNLPTRRSCRLSTSGGENPETLRLVVCYFLGRRESSGESRASYRIQRAGCGGRLSPEIRSALTFGCVPCGPGRYRLPAALAAAEPQAGLGHIYVSGYGVDVDVGFMAASLARRRDRADAVLAHVRQRHGRPGLAAHGVRLPNGGGSAGRSGRRPVCEDGGAGDNGEAPRHDR
jgi:hypothetical protein